MSTKKPSSAEDEYISRDEAKRRELEAIRKRQVEKEAARQMRVGTCPRGCETKLVEEGFRELRIDRCPTCKGVWLDPGELDKIASDDAGAVRALMNFFSGRS